MITIRKNIDLKEMTTFGISAKCGCLFEFSNPNSDLPMLDRQGLLDDALIIGGGSNLLFTGYTRHAAVVHPVAKAIELLSKDDDTALVRVDAGVVLDELCLAMAQQGLWGTENLSGVPGHIGGATVQNVGAYGAEFKDVVESVKCYSRKQHKFVTLSNADCQYGYRDSFFKHLPNDELLIVCDVTLRLSCKPQPNMQYKGLQTAMAGKEPTPMLIRQTVIELRNSKLPRPEETGSAGSFFKNPVVSKQELARLQSVWANLPENQSSPAPLPYHEQVDGSAKLSAAWLIDKSGCKPMTCGGAALWQTQPLVLVNRSGNATGTDIVGLEKMVINQVQERFGITLSPEVIHV
jgi:UDP-N-acetylmuramate dehydrogenase